MSYSYENRIQDTRLNRFFTRDPLNQLYPSLSPYNYVAGNPIVLYDQGGAIIRLMSSSGSPISFNSVEELLANQSSYGDDSFIGKTINLLISIHGLGDPTVMEAIEKSETVTIHHVIEDSKYSNKSISFDPNFRFEEISNKSARILIRMNKIIDKRENLRLRDALNQKYSFFKNFMVEGTGSFVEADENLVHELGHFLNAMTKNNYSGRMKDPSLLYDDAEERYVIKGRERRYRKLKGKKTRTGGHVAFKRNFMGRRTIGSTRKQKSRYFRENFKRRKKDRR